MKQNSNYLGASFKFAATLSGIAVVGNIVGMFIGNPDVAMNTFLCFLPVAFWMADATQRQTRAYIEALEARVRELETAQELS